MPSPFLLPRRRARTIACTAFAAAAACTGPVLHVHNPDEHAVFVDGLAVQKDVLPFRYYGTTRWDALPASDEHAVEFPELPASERVQLPPPASPWLFPLDLPLEMVDRLLSGRRDRALHIDVPAAPPELRGGFDVDPAELAAVAERARLARIAR